MNPKRRGRYVLLGGYAGAALLQLPAVFLADQLTGTVGGLLFVMPLLAWRWVAAMTTDAFADLHGELLVWTLTLLIYCAAFSIVALPAHWLTRKASRAHAIAIGAVTLVFDATLALAFPVHGLP